VDVYSDETGGLELLPPQSKRRKKVIDILDRAFNLIQSPSGKTAMVTAAKDLIQERGRRNTMCLFDPKSRRPDYSRLPATVALFLEKMKLNFPDITLGWVDDGEAATIRTRQQWATAEEESELQNFTPSDVGMMLLHRNVSLLCLQ